MFGALKYKIFSSHYVTVTLKRVVASKQNLPSFLNYGLKFVENNITPILTDNLPALLVLVEVCTCGCKTGCKTDRSKCRKSDFACTDTCKSVQCENNDCWIENKENVFKKEADGK